MTTATAGLRVEVAMGWQESFTAFLRGKAKSERTIEAYVSDVRSFAAWFERENQQAFTLDLLTSFDLQGWRVFSLENEQVSPATWNRRRASMIVLAGWAQEIGVLSYDPTSDLRAKEAVALAPRWLDTKQFGQLMRVVERQVNGATSAAGRRQALRDQAVVALMAYAGLREGEVCGLLASDVELSERKGRVVVRSGKGDKERSVPLNEHARKAVRAWMDVRGGGQGPLFIGKHGDALQARGVQRRVAELGRLAGVECTPHQLRHTFAKRCLDKGGQLTEVRDLLGHTRLETTARYVKPGWGDLVAAVDRI